MFNKIKLFFLGDVWNCSLNKQKGLRHFTIKWLRIGCLAFRGFFADKCSLSASSLTYYTLMSMVPVFALAFAISMGFGYNKVFREELLERFPDQNQFLIELFKYADQFLIHAKGGVIAGVGLVILFLTVAFLLSSLEGILNQIWGVKSLRSWKRILSDYFALMLIAPIFFVIASSAAVFVVRHLGMGIRALPLSAWGASWLLFLVNLIPYGLFWLLFTFLYLFMPNTQVQFKSAAIAGVFTSCLYLTLQWGYIYFQVGVSSYGAIYGSMAALPLFLVWIQISWFLFLLGAEVGWAHQTVYHHEFEGAVSRMSNRYKRLISLWVLHLAVKKGILSSKDLSEAHQLPFALSKRVLEELTASGLLYETAEGYVPHHPVYEMTLLECLTALESRGENHFSWIDSKPLAVFEKSLETFQKAIESSPANIRISHVPDTI